MIHLKKYEDFSKIDEGLDRDDRIIKFLPKIIISLVVNKLFGVYQMLNTQWSELKNSTKDSNYDSLFSRGVSSILTSELTKVGKKYLPDNSLKLGMFLRNWNIYLSSDKTKEYDLERPIIYISKDELKKGDRHLCYKLSDNEVYPDFNKIDKDRLITYPIILISAKFDMSEDLDIINQNIEDICLDFSDDYNSKVNVSVKPHGDFILLGAKLDSVIFSDKLGTDIEDISERVKDYLSMYGYNFNYLIKYKIHSASKEFNEDENDLPLFYFGNKPPFDKIITEAKKYTDRYQYDSDNPLWSNRYKALDIRELSSMRYSESSNLSLTTDGIKTLLSDMDNCFTVLGDENIRTSWNRTSKFKPLDIMVDYISIIYIKAK